MTDKNDEHSHMQMQGPSASTIHYQMSSEKENQLRRLYKELDHDKDGRINVKDLTFALRQKVPGRQEASTYAKKIMATADTSRNDAIDFPEFAHYVLEHEKKLELVFKDLDKNRDGRIDVKELKSYLQQLGIQVSDAEASQIVGKMDTNRNFSIDLSEFQKFMLLHPTYDLKDMIKFWRHSMVLDIGEDSLVPEDFSEVEIKTGVWWRHLVAGGIAGAVSRTATAPLDRLKVFLQVHASKANNLRVRTAFEYLMKEGGVKSLWRGNGVNIIKIAPESAIKFMAYEQTKRFVKSNNSGELTIVQRLLSGSFAGAVAQTIIYPMEVLKTRLALRKTGEMNQGIAHAAKSIYCAEGLRTFYRGYIPNTIGIIPYAGIDLCIYERFREMLLNQTTCVVNFHTLSTEKAFLDFIGA